MQDDVQKRIKETEKKLLELPHVARQQKVTAMTVECRNFCTKSSSLYYLYSKSLYPRFISLHPQSSLILVLLSVHLQALVQALQQESTDLFTELVKSVDQTGAEVGELLSIHETSFGSQVEGQVNRLEQEVARLRWKSEELKQLADMQDHICFLKVIQLNFTG